MTINSSSTFPKALRLEMILCYNLDTSSIPGTTTPVESGPGSNGNEDVLYIPQSSKTRAWFSYQGSQELRCLYHSSNPPAVWAISFGLTAPPQKKRKKIDIIFALSYQRKTECILHLKKAKEGITRNVL